MQSFSDCHHAGRSVLRVQRHLERVIRPGVHASRSNLVARSTTGTMTTRTRASLAGDVNPDSPWVRSYRFPGRQSLAGLNRPDPAPGSQLMTRMIDSVSTDVPDGFDEVKKPRLNADAARRRGAGLLDRPGTSNARPRPSTADSNTSAARPLGFRNLTNYIARRLLESGGFRRVKERAGLFIRTFMCGHRPHMSTEPGVRLSITITADASGDRLS